MYIRIRLLLLICSFILFFLPPIFKMYLVYWNHAAAAAYSSLCFFIFLYLQFSNKIFVTLFSRTVRPRRLKLGTHGQWAAVSCIPESGCCCLFVPLFLHFLSNFQTLKFFVTLSSGTVRPRRLKLGTHVESGQMYRVYWNKAPAFYLSLYFFIFLSLQLSNIKNFHHIFLRNCEV